MKNLYAIILILAISGCGPRSPVPTNSDGYVTQVPFHVYILKDGTRCALARAEFALAMDCDWIQK